MFDNFISSFSQQQPIITPETCFLMLKKVREEREQGVYEAGGEIFKGLMYEFEKTIEAFCGSYMVLLSIFSYQLGQNTFSKENVSTKTQKGSVV